MGTNKGMGKKSMPWTQRRANRGAAMRKRAGLEAIPKAPFKGMGHVGPK